MPQEEHKTEHKKHAVNEKRKMKKWILAAILICVALFLIFILLFLSFLFIPAVRNGKGLSIVMDPRVAATSTEFAAGSPLFVQTLASITNTAVGQDENISIIDTGDRFLAILLQEIDGASSSVDFTDYVWSNGTFSNDVAAALTAAARRGVSVHVLLDAVGGHTMPKSLIDDIEAAGGQVEKYHTFSILHPYQYDERDHVRSIVIDGKIGFFGGMGIGDDWMKNPPGTSPTPEWKDVMFEVGGNMAVSLQGVFQELWNETTGQILTGPAFYPQIQSPQQPIEQSQSPQPPQTSDAVTSASASFVSVMSVPSGNLEPVRDTFLLTIASARKSLYIVSPFIIPDRGMLDAIEARARAGVDVRIVSPGDTTYAPYLRDAWQADYGELLKAGVHLYEYEPSMIHEKYIIADGAWSVIGSANMDSRSESINAENIMGISDPAFAKGLGTVFAGDIASSKEITLAEWKNRNIFAKMMSGFLLLFSKQL